MGGRSATGKGQHPPVGPCQDQPKYPERLVHFSFSLYAEKYLGCHCKSQMHLNEVILDGTDISKAIIDYATGNAITDIVVGASTRNTFIRYILINSPWLCHITFL